MRADLRHNEEMAVNRRREFRWKSPPPLFQLLKASQLEIILAIANAHPHQLL
jgi:hypothetical protein